MNKRIKKKKNKSIIHKECWNLDVSFYKWLEKRLPIYLEDANAVIELDTYKFDIFGQELTQREVIKAMISDLKYILNPKVSDWSKEYDDTVNHLMKCWSEVIEAMWW